MQRVEEKCFPESSSVKESDMDSCSIAAPNISKKKSQYQYSGYDKAIVIRDTLNCNMITLLILLLFISIATYALILSLKYTVVATGFYGEADNCLQARIKFNGWNFRYECVSCAEGWKENKQGKYCKPENENEQETVPPQPSQGQQQAHGNHH